MWRLYRDIAQVKFHFSSLCFPVKDFYTYNIRSQYIRSIHSTDLVGCADVAMKNAIFVSSVQCKKYQYNIDTETYINTDP